MKKRSLLIMMLFVAMGLILSACTKDDETSDDFSNITEKGYVTMGLDDTFAPMGFRDQGGDIVGFDVDLAKEAFERIDLEVKFQPIDWAMKETELNSGNIDLIWNGYTITPEREEKVAFTKPYLENRQIIITLSASSIKEKKDLEGKKVAAQSGSSSLDAINKEPEILQLFEGGKPVLFETNNDAFMDMEAGRVDAIVADEILARYYIQKRGADQYRVLEEDFGEEVYGIGLRKESTELLNKLESALDDMREDNSAAEISKKWFGANILK